MNALSDKQLPGSGPDVTTETPVCQTKKMPCCYWTDDGCMIDVCWMDGNSSGPETEKE